MSNPNYWQAQNSQQPQQAQPSQPSQQAQQWQGNNVQNWTGGYSQPQQPQPQPQQGYPNNYGYPGGYQGNYQGNPQGNYQGTRQGNFQGSGYQGGYSQGYPNNYGYQNGNFGYQSKYARPAAAKKFFLAALIFACIYALGSIFELIYNAVKGLRVLPVWSWGNISLLSALSGEAFLWIPMGLGVLGAVFMILASVSSRLSWSAAVASFLWAQIGLLNLISFCASGVFDTFGKLDTSSLIYYILYMAANLVFLISWLLISLHYILKGRGIRNGTKNVLAVISLLFWAGELVYYLVNLLLASGGAMDTAYLLVWFGVSLVCVRLCMHLAVLACSPHR